VSRSRGQSSRGRSANLAALLLVAALVGAVHIHHVGPDHGARPALDTALHEIPVFGGCPACALGQHPSTAPAGLPAVVPARVAPAAPVAVARIILEDPRPRSRTPRAPPRSV